MPFLPGVPIAQQQQGNVSEDQQRSGLVADDLQRSLIDGTFNKEDYIADVVSKEFAFQSNPNPINNTEPAPQRFAANPVQGQTPAFTAPQQGSPGVTGQTTTDLAERIRQMLPKAPETVAPVQVAPVQTAPTAPMVDSNSDEFGEFAELFQSPVSKAATPAAPVQEVKPAATETQPGPTQEQIENLRSAVQYHNLVSDQVGQLEANAVAQGITREQLQTALNGVTLEDVMQVVRAKLGMNRPTPPISANNFPAPPAVTIQRRGIQATELLI